MKVADLFSGGGGFTEGATMAGMEVVVAANHSRIAIETHARNHPKTAHFCQDLHQANFHEFPRHDGLLASPCCQGHTHARGKDRPHHDKQRSTAWAFISCVEAHREDWAITENVPEFADWILYDAWLGAMHRLGYACRPYLIDAADHGVPQHRLRLLNVFTRSKHPIELDLPTREHMPVSTVIEWDAGNWSPIDKPGRSPATLRRIEAGRRRFGSRFVAPYYGSGSGTTGRSINRPIGTLTTKDRWAIIDGDRMRMVSISEAKSIMGFRKDYYLPKNRVDAMRLLGNAVSPIMVFDVLSALRKAA